MTAPPLTAHARARELQRAAPLTVDLHSYQFRDADETAWWLLPRRENPAFHRAKIAVWNHEARDAHFVGWGVEKGIGPGAAAAFVHQPARVMTPAWAWHAALRDLRSGALNAAAGAAARAAAHPLELLVRAFVLGDRSAGTDTLRWVISPDLTLQAAGPRQAAPGPLLHGGLHDAARLAHVAALLPATDDPALWDRLWVDLYIGRSYSGHAAPHGVWDTTLTPWLERL